MTQDAIEALQAAADAGAFTLAEDLRRRYNLCNCTICGVSTVNGDWRVWRQTSIRVCHVCIYFRCVTKSRSQNELRAIRCGTIYTYNDMNDLNRHRSKVMDDPHPTLSAALHALGVKLDSSE
jgi:hypothetical protein